MRFEVVVALRYLRTGRLQTVLILLGVALGMIIYTLIASLINGLQDRLAEDVLGNVAHVTLEPPDRIPRLIDIPEDARPLVGRERAEERRERITGWRPLVERVEAAGGVAVASAQAVGGGFIQRGEEIVPVTLNGVRPEKVSAIVDVAGGLLQGSLQLGPGDVIIGSDLAEELALTVGQRIRIRSERERARSFTVRGIFDIGTAGINEQLVFLELSTAQRLLELDGAVTVIELKVDDIWAAPAVARRLGASTRLEATDWISENERLRDALRAQNQSGYLIRGLSLLTIVIGVAGVLLVAAIRRSEEIGIMRSMGVSRGSVTAIFLLQGLFTGVFGSILGAGMGYLLASILRQATLRLDGTPAIPVDPARGEYLTAMALATLASSLAAIIPARSASNVDPVEVLTT